jgi:hypothetical protein
MTRLIIKTALVFLVLLLPWHSCFAASISFAGTFLTDDDVQQFAFTVVSTGTVDILSLGYGGGTNAQGQSISPGGFATSLALFDGTVAGSNLIAQDSVGGTAPGACSPRNIDPSTGLCLDAFLSLTLGPGTYLVVLTEQPNSANGPTLGDGFALSGTGNFTGGPFIDPFGNPRTANFALDISGPLAGSQTPEPATAGLAASALLLLAAFRRRLTAR